MVDVGFPLAAAFLFAGTGLAVWRSIRGPARGRVGTLRRAAILCLVLMPLVTWSAWKISNSRRFQLFGEMVPRVETSAPVGSIRDSARPLRVVRPSKEVARL